ncbi:MAG: alanine racemase, partial [Spirochaetota bacterium]|nr:alanine racemase [Spirochaetota bacterium]
MDWRSQVYRPALVVRPDRVKKNFDRMQEKAAASGVVFRPHFKTHQSAFVGEWFKSRGLEQITVSSVRMALYFAGHGWKDITIAFPVNLREIEDIRDLAGRVRLNLLLLSKETAEELNGKLSEKVGIWIKVDVGYGRTGIPWNEEEKIVDLARTVEALPKLEFRGLLTHAGQTYHMHDRQERAELFVQITEGLNRLRERVLEAGITNCLLSVGDTPGTTAAADFRGVDEVRPGNFVYFDAQQWHLGSCEEGEIAAAVDDYLVPLRVHGNYRAGYGGGNLVLFTGTEVPLLGIEV